MSWLTPWFGPWFASAAAVAGLAMLAHSLVGLVAIWAALGRPHWFIRLAVLGGVLSLGLPIGAYDLILIFATQSLMVLVPLTLFRLRLGRIGQEDADAPEGRAAEPRRRPQFSLLDSLLATAVVAALVAFAVHVAANVWEVWEGNILLPLFRPAGMAPIPTMYLYLPFSWTPAAPWLVFGSVAVFFGLSTLAAAWIGLGQRLLWLRLILLCLIPTSVIMAVWLGLWGETAYWGKKERQRDPSAAAAAAPTRPRVVARWAAKLALAVTSLGMLLVLGRVYYVLATPLAIPETTLPGENAYSTLVRAGQSLQHVGALDPDTATQEQLGDLVRPEEDAFEQVRAALGQPCQVPVDYKLADLDLAAVQSLRSLARSLHAEGKLAEMEGRTEDAVESYRDVIRLGQAGARGGLLVHALVGWAIEGMGMARLRDLRDELSPAQCGDLIDFLQAYDADREPLEHITLRDRTWIHQALGWQGRLVDFIDGFSVAMEAAEQPKRRTQATMRLLICELAVQTYRSNHGRLPESLADLVPDYLLTVPEDPFNGRPLVYRRTSSGYLLYSVGMDGRDDGGVNKEWGLVDTPADLFLDEPAEGEEDKTDPGA